MTRDGVARESSLFNPTDGINALSLEPMVRERLARIGCWRRVPSGCLLFEIGDAASFLFGLDEGAVALVGSGGGPAGPARHALSPCWIGAEAALAGRPHDLKATVLSPARVYIIAATQFRALAASGASGRRAAREIAEADAAIRRECARPPAPSRGHR